MQQFLFDCTFNNFDGIVHSTNKIILDIHVNLSLHMLSQNEIETKNDHNHFSFPVPSAIRARRETTLQ